MSSDQAKTYHSINIGEKNTWDDWHLVPSSRPLVNPPDVKTNYIEIPGRDGSMDLTTALIGRPVYKNRTGDWEFIVLNEYDDGEDWTTLYTDIMQYLQGREFKVILDDDPGFFYYGRLKVNSWQSQANWSRIVINYNLGPYKYDLAYSDEGWIWDPFNFETGIVHNYNNLPVVGTLSTVVISLTANYIPVILSSVDGMTVTYNGSTHVLQKGANTISDIKLAEGENTLVFNGNGMITIDIKGGWL